MTLRDGLLVDLVGNWQVSENQILHKTTLTRSTPAKSGNDKKFLKFLEERAQHYQTDVAHARHIATLATSLFDQLKAAGADFSDEERKYLLVASYLHDVGQIISQERHNHHSAYIIRHTKFPEMTQLDNKKCALIALFHRKDEPPKKSALPWGITGIHADQVRRMSALLRLADGLDEDHTQNIDTLAIKIRKKQALLELVQMRSDPLNLPYFKEKSGYFEELFGVKIISFVHPRRLGRGRSILN
jgi:exopolyphosphatase/guanosine-5'-triphosphate,3'-diphosphate pyrophosphatase